MRFFSHLSTYHCTFQITDFDVPEILTILIHLHVLVHYARVIYQVEMRIYALTITFLHELNHEKHHLERLDQLNSDYYSLSINAPNKEYRKAHKLGLKKCNTNDIVRKA